MGVAVAHDISPELVLVCPELREHALTLLPPLDPDELFAVEPRAVAAPAPERPRLVVSAPRPVPARAPAPRTPFPVAVAAYATEALLLGAIRGAVLIAAIGVVAFLLAR